MPLLLDLPRAIARVALRALVVGALVVAAGCQTPIAPPPTVAPPSGPARAVFTATDYDNVPGWKDDRVQAAWPAFRVGCSVLANRERTRLLWQAPCATAEAVDPDDAVAVRRFFEANFTPYRVSATDGAEAGLVTGYYEPLLYGSRTPGPAFRAPLYAPPDDLVVVELADLYPELKGKRVRGRLDGRRVVP